MLISPTQSNAQAAIRAFILNVLPGAVGQNPAVFQGSISGTTLTVSALPGLPAGGIQGAITPNSPLLGAAPGTVIQNQLTGTTGGIGTYQVSISQTIAGPATMATGVSVVAGLPNRTPEPNNPWFVVITPMSWRRLGTNQDTEGDVRFTGSIAGTTMTVSAVQIGKLITGAQVLGPGVAANTTILAQLTGPAGGAGTYQVSTTQTVAPQTLSAGGRTLMQSGELMMQLDFHAPDTSASDFAQAISTALRDDYGVSFFAALAPPLNGVVPLYADDPKMAPFINAENQYEWRWILECRVQVDQTVAIPQAYADAVTVTLIEIP